RLDREIEIFRQARDRRLDEAAIGLHERRLSGAVERVAQRGRFELRERGGARVTELLDLVAQQHLAVLEHALPEDFGATLGVRELADDAADAPGSAPQALAGSALEQTEEAIAREGRRREHERAEERVVVDGVRAHDVSAPPFWCSSSAA